MVFFKAGLKPLEYLKGFIDRGFKDINFLETAGERSILFKDAPVLLLGGRSDAAKVA